MAEPRLNVAQILHPRSVAVIGASENPAKFGGRIMRYLTMHRFPGRIVPVNPSRAEILGLPAYPNIGAAPGPVDVCILAVPPDALVQACQECAAAGVGCCVVMTTGFAEIGEVGAARQRELEALRAETGMRIVGPNCMGLINPHHALALTSSLVLEEGELARGRVGLISQSGALMVSMYDRARAACIGFSACVSLGNQSDVEICDVLDYMIGDPRSEAICLYVEGFRDPRRFLRLAGECRRAGKPLLMVKSGRTEAGVRAAMSHTASLAGSYAVLSVACETQGVLLLPDPDDMIRAADALLRWGIPRADGVAVLSPSGGGAGTGIDRLGEAGMRPAELSAQTRTALAEHLLPSFCGNPVDLGGRRNADAPGIAGDLVRILADDPGTGALFVVLTTVPNYTATTAALGEALLRSGKPFVLAVTPGASADAPRAALREIGCPYFDHVDSALRVLRTLMDARRLAALPAAEEPRRPAGLPAPDRIAGLPAGRLTEAEAKALAAAYGIPASAERVCADVDQAAAAAAAIGYPVALKAVCRELVHKSDAGAVRLNIPDEAALRDAWPEVIGGARRAVPGVRVEGGLVQRMYRGEIEIILGVRRDPQFGPVLLVGAGGTVVELRGDVALAPAPVDPAGVEAMLRRLSIWPLFSGWRGRPALDVAAITDAACRLGWLAQDLGERLIELELNPVLVRAAGEGVVAVDARATLA